jgi:hypothetical protein
MEAAIASFAHDLLVRFVQGAVALIVLVPTMLLGLRKLEII